MIMADRTKPDIILGKIESFARTPQTEYGYCRSKKQRLYDCSDGGCAGRPQWQAAKAGSGTPELLSRYNSLYVGDTVKPPPALMRI